MDTQNQNLTNDEKSLSMFSHFSLLIGGLILPLIIWAVKKDDSKFIRFHSLQSIFYHIAFIAAVILYAVFFIFIILLSGLWLNVFNESGKSSELPALFIVIIIIFGFGFLILALGGIIYSIYLGIKANKGSLIQIPLIGNKVYNIVYGKSKFI